MTFESNKPTTFYVTLLHELLVAFTKAGYVPKLFFAK